MPDPTLELQLLWRGVVGRLRVREGEVQAETNYGRADLVAVPMAQVERWFSAPAEIDACTIVFVTPDDSYSVLLDRRDEPMALVALRRTLGEPQPDAV